MYYKATDNSVHFLDDDRFISLLPAGSVPITEAQAAALAPQPDAQAAIEAAKAQVRLVREQILNRLSGIALAANLSGDTAIVAAYLIARQGLLDITKDLPATLPEVTAAIGARYAGIAIAARAAAPTLAAAFDGVDA